MIDTSLDQVVSPASDKPLYFQRLPCLQPETRDVVHAVLGGEPFHYTDAPPHRCVLRDGVWHDEGPIPSPVDASWHPDLPHFLGELVEMTRRVIRSIPRCHSVQLILSYVRAGEDRFQSDALFYRQDSQDPSAPYGCIPDTVLDRIPFVRLIERGALAFQSFFAIKGYDDGSGYEGELSIEIAPRHLAITHEDDEGDKLTLTSELVDGQWNHTTTLRTWERLGDEGPSPVSILRTLANPETSAVDLFALTSFAKCFPHVSGVGATVDRAEDILDTYTIHFVPGALRAAPELSAAA